MSGSIQVCTRCILSDADQTSIDFDAHGVCSFCREWDQVHKTTALNPTAAQEKLTRTVEEIRARGRNLPYDSVLGISGGVDSTYLALQAKNLGLRPLVVHMDNGWNSELAVHNIENICKKLDFDLYTHVVNWEEFRDLHLSYLRASVIDIEVPTDHAIFALLYHIAAKHKIRSILSGANRATEGVLPPEWTWNKMDLLNLTSIHRRYGHVPLKTFPSLSFLQGTWFQLVKKIRPVELLNYLPYQKEEAKRTIEKELGWRDYGGKHYESIFTRFYQGYILPRKFGVDKRKAHLSTLILSGQITRSDALKELEKPPYDPEQPKIDREFVLKKLGLSESEFEQLMSAPPVPHSSFPTYERYHYRYHKMFARLIRPVTRLIKKTPR